MSRQVQYIGALTPMRGIAALGVILFHFEATLRMSGYAPFIDAARSHVSHRSYLWVDFFFILSGFVITHVYGSRLGSGATGAHRLDYILARFSRIYPLHLATLASHIGLYVLLLCTDPATVEKVKHFYDWRALPLQLTLLISMNFTAVHTWNGPAWSIGAEWYSYLFALVLIPWIHTGQLKRSWLAVVCSLLASILLLSLYPTKSFLGMDANYGWLRCLFEFSLGIAVYRLYLEGVGRRWLSSDATFGAALLLVLALLHFNTFDFLILPVFALLVLTTASNNGLANRMLETRPARLLGDISYSVYMVQFWWFVMLGGWLHKNRQPYAAEMHFQQKFVILVATSAIIVINALLTRRFIEKPAQVWIRHWWGTRAANRVVSSAPASSD